MIETILLLAAAQAADAAVPPNRARAQANLASYVAENDYPRSAFQAGEQGTVRFRLDVGSDGRVTDCIVTGTSGSEALDEATCRVMRSRARFVPARDSSGNPTDDVVNSSITWRMAQTAPSSTP